MEVPVFYMFLKEAIVPVIGDLEYLWIKGVPQGALRENVENHVCDWEKKFGWNIVGR